jgi:hypothetical protein
LLSCGHQTELPSPAEGRVSASLASKASSTADPWRNRRLSSPFRPLRFLSFWVSPVHLGSRAPLSAIGLKIEPPEGLDLRLSLCLSRPHGFLLTVSPDFPPLIYSLCLVEEQSPPHLPSRMET